MPAVPRRERVKPTPAQVREAAAAGHAHALTGVGEWNPYAEGNVGLLTRVWKDAYRATVQERREAAGLPPVSTREETAERFAKLGIEMI